MGGKKKRILFAKCQECFFSELNLRGWIYQRRERFVYGFVFLPFAGGGRTMNMYGRMMDFPFLFLFLQMKTYIHTHTQL